MNDWTDRPAVAEMSDAFSVVMQFWQLTVWKAGGTPTMHTGLSPTTHMPAGGSAGAGRPWVQFPAGSLGGGGVAQAGTGRQAAAARTARVSHDSRVDGEDVGDRQECDEAAAQLLGESSVALPHLKEAADSLRRVPRRLSK